MEMPSGQLGLELKGNPLWGRKPGVVGIDTDTFVGAVLAQGHEKRKMSRTEL